MAYNFRNALVNLNEEIRKSGGGGGGDLPAVKLAVSQLQVSMTAVKASVASVTAEVNQIKAALSSLSPATTEHSNGQWLGSDRKSITISQDITLRTSGVTIDSEIPITVPFCYIDTSNTWFDRTSSGVIYPIPLAAASGSAILSAFLEKGSTNYIINVKAGSDFNNIAGHIYVTLNYGIAPTTEKGGK